MLEKIERTSAAVARPRTGTAVAVQPDQKTRVKRISKQRKRWNGLKELLFASSRKGSHLAGRPSSRKRRDEVAE